MYSHAAWSCPGSSNLKTLLACGLLSSVSAGANRRAYLFDEVHRLYKDRGQRSLDFWQWTEACHLQEGESKPTLIIMAANYGDKRSDIRGSTGTDSPVTARLELSEEQLVSLAPATDTTGSLQLTTGEWEELWGGFLSQTGLPLDAAVQRFIWSICGGQVS